MVKRKEYFYNNDLIQSNYDFSIKVINGLLYNSQKGIKEENLKLLMYFEVAQNSGYYFRAFELSCFCFLVV